MGTLRKQAESDLSFMLEGPDWGMPVILKGPQAGANAGETQEVEGQVLRSVIGTNPETGEPVFSPNPVVTLRTSSLSPVPAESDKWYIEVPSTPDPDSAKEAFLFDGSKALENNRAFGFIKIFLTNAEQITP